METNKALYLAHKSKAPLAKQEVCLDKAKAPLAKKEVFLDNLLSQFWEEAFFKNLLKVFLDYHQLKLLNKTLIIGVHHPSSQQRNMMMASFK